MTVQPTNPAPNAAANSRTIRVLYSRFIRVPCFSSCENCEVLQNDGYRCTARHPTEDSIRDQRLPGARPEICRQTCLTPYPAWVLRALAGLRTTVVLYNNSLNAKTPVGASPVFSGSLQLEFPTEFHFRPSMSSFLLHQSRFFTTVNHLKDLPPTPQPEIAFAGRSNAGKSTAINLLCNQKRLAFASKTPGSHAAHQLLLRSARLTNPRRMWSTCRATGTRKYRAMPSCIGRHCYPPICRAAAQLRRHDPDDGFAPSADRSRQDHARLVCADGQANSRSADEMRQIDAAGKHQHVARDARKRSRNTRRPGIAAN